jgi:hypothetical protein
MKYVSLFALLGALGCGSLLGLDDVQRVKDAPTDASGGAGGNDGSNVGGSGGTNGSGGASGSGGGAGGAGGAGTGGGGSGGGSATCKFNESRFDDGCVLAP